MKPFILILLLLSVIGSASAQSTGKYASVNGLQLYYEIHGNGYPLVLIHGGGSTIGTSFGRILPELAKTNQVIAVELQAHGHTADIDRPLSFKQDADDVAELLRQLHIAKANVFGFSNGASTTLQMAIRHPLLVNKIIVASTMYKKQGADPGFWEMIKHARFEEMPQPLKDAYLAINLDTSALYQMYKRDIQRMQTFSDIPKSDISAINAPALIIAGDKDVVRPEHAVEMYRDIQHAQLAIFPWGHGDYMGEITTDNSQPPLALKVIQKFLAEPISAPKSE